MWCLVWPQNRYWHAKTVSGFSLSCKSPMIDHVLSNLQLDGNRAIKWFTDNGVQANPDKLQFMIILPDDNSTRSLALNENTVIVSEKHVKVLGVEIDCRLKKFLHISSVCTKATCPLNALARISNYLDVSACRMIYNSFVASNFNYCPLVWHFCGVSNSYKMEKLHERCLRIVYKDYDSSYDRLLEMANTPSLVISRLRILLPEVYKSIHHLNPKCISGLFEVKSTNYSLRNAVKLVQPMKRTSTFGIRSVSYAGAKLWNDSSPLLSNDIEIEDFKSLMKF